MIAAGAPDRTSCIPQHVPFDRSVDVRAFGPHQSSASQDFLDNLPDLPPFPEDQKCKLTSLPAIVRRLIVSYVLPQPEDGRKVTLAPEFAISQFYPEDYFLDPFWDILQDAEGLMLASKQHRDDVQTYFWTTYHFHISLSSFTTPALSKLTMQWLPLYADRIQHLSVELDFTRLGLSSRPSAPLLATGVDKMKVLIDDLVKSLVARSAGRHMAEIHLMCRRYKGMRPNTHAPSLESISNG